MSRTRKNEERTLSPLGSYLAGARRERGVTQKAVADYCGLQQSDISKIEQGLRSPSIPHLMKMAQMLQIPLQWFLTGKHRPGMSLREVAIELHHLGLVDLRIPDARVPGSFRPPEDVLAGVVSVDRPDPRVVEAMPAVLAWNVWNPHLLEAYGYTYDPRAAHRLAWLADVALTIHHNHVFPGGFVDPVRVSEFMRRIRPPAEMDDLGYPARDERLAPVSKRWHIGYAAPLSAFHDRAKHLLPLWREAKGSSTGCGDGEHG